MRHFHVPDMTCDGCLRAVIRALQTLDPLARIEGDLDARTITVTSTKEETALLAVLSSAGYPAIPLLQQGA